MFWCVAAKAPRCTGPHGGQSLSVAEVHPSGQQPSSAIHAVMEVWVQATLQLALLPVIPSVVQALPSSQLVGQAPGPDAIPLSQVSPDSTTPLPQLGEQSESVFALHPAGQQPSSATHVVMEV